MHEDILNERHTHYWLAGGRGSGKSSFAAIEIVYGLTRDENANAVVLRKAARNIRDTVFAQIAWAIEALGVSEDWTEKVSVTEMVNERTEQKIIFRGADNHKKIRSTKFKKGYCKYVWYEETDEFKGDAEIRAINQSLLRGGAKFFVLYSFNPPSSLRSWVNQEFIAVRPDKAEIKSTYLDLPRDWLGEQFIIEAEHLKKTKPDKYAHEYMGEAVGDGAEIFRNVDIRAISDEEIKGFSQLRKGIDFGYAVDPFVYVCGNYDAKKKILYIFAEVYRRGLPNAEAFRLVQETDKLAGVVGITKTVYADSAEPKSIDELKTLGLKITGAKKGRDSVKFGIKFLQDLEKIVIDGTRCPNSAKEFIEYEYRQDGRGGFLSEYPDENNHAIDAVRYALELDSRAVVKAKAKTAFKGKL